MRCSLRVGRLTYLTRNRAVPGSAGSRPSSGVVHQRGVRALDLRDRCSAALRRPQVARKHVRAPTPAETDGLVPTHGVGSCSWPGRRRRGAVAFGLNTIAVLIGGLDPFYLPLLRGIEDVAGERGMLVLVVDTRDSPTLADAMTRRLTARGVDGIIAVSVGDLPVRQSGLEGRRLPPIVYVDQPDRRGYSLLFDGAGAGYTATRHLIEHGHDRVGLAHGPPEHAERRAGPQRLHACARGTRQPPVSRRSSPSCPTSPSRPAGRPLPAARSAGSPVEPSSPPAPTSPWARCTRQVTRTAPTARPGDRRLHRTRPRPARRARTHHGRRPGTRDRPPVHAHARRPYRRPVATETTHRVPHQLIVRDSCGSHPPASTTSPSREHLVVRSQPSSRP